MSRDGRSTSAAGMRAPLRYPAFRYLAAGRVVTMAGNAVAPIALAFAVLDLTGSVRDLGLVVGTRTLFNVLFILFGGVVADRFPRQIVMVVSSVLAAGSQGIVAALVLTDTATVGLLMVLAAVNGTVSAFAFPAASALLAQTVPVEIRKQANAINRLGINAAMIGGSALGGLLVAAVGPGWGLAVDATTFAVAAALFALVRVAPYRREATPRTGTLHELREGWTEFVARTWVWVVVLGFMFLNMAFVASLHVLGPVVADTTFGRQAWGFVLAAETAGMVAGAVVALRLRVRRLLLVGVACCLGEALFIAALGLTPRVVVLLPVAFVAGLAIEQFAIAWETSIQEHIPADRLARVYSYDALGSFIAIPIGQVAVGPLAVAIGVVPALIVAAAVSGLAVVGMLASRDVRTLEHHAADPTEPVDPEPVDPEGRGHDVEIMKSP
jgi:MFS family permease